MSSLRLDWCSHEAAKYACEKWHYSGVIPKSKLAKIGVWEHGAFIGAVIFGVGANNNMLSPYGLAKTEGAELVRIALRSHESPVSRIVAVGLRLLKRQSPGLRLVVSYADPEEGHAGGIYQAGNWTYTGQTSPVDYYRQTDGTLVIWRQARRLQKRGLPLEKVYLPGKHRYLYPLDEEMRRRIAPLAKPYPKRASEAGHPPRPGAERRCNADPDAPTKHQTQANDHRKEVTR